MGSALRRVKNPVSLSLDIALDTLFDPKDYSSQQSFPVSECRHFTHGKTCGRHIFSSGRKIISLSVQGKEGVENAVLKTVGLGSREEAVLHSIPSHGCNYREVVPQDRR